MRYIYPTTMSVEDFRLGQAYMQGAMNVPAAQVMRNIGFSVEDGTFVWACPEAKITFYIDEEEKVVMEVSCELNYELIGAFMAHGTSLILRSADYSRQVSTLRTMATSFEAMAERITGSHKHTLH